MSKTRRELIEELLEMFRDWAINESMSDDYSVNGQSRRRQANKIKIAIVDRFDLLLGQPN